MSVVGIAMVRDEADIVGQTVAWMREQCDAVMVADNGSADGTREILEGLDVTVLDDTDPAYYQSRKMTALAALAAESDADWVVPFDADEIWYSPHGRIADVLEEMAADGASIATAELYDHVATGVDPEGDPISRMGWRRREPAPLRKVACRALAPVTIHQGNHGADYGGTVGGLVVRHFPYRSVEQFVSKVRNGAAAYAATDLPEDAGRHWREYGRLLESGGEEAIGEVFRAWFWSATPKADPSLIFDPLSSFPISKDVPTASAP